MRPHILVPYDASPAADAALEWAAARARDLGGRLTVLRVVTMPPVVLVSTGVPSSGALTRESLEADRVELAAHVAACGIEGAAVELGAAIHVGRHVVERAAELGVDEIVMGSRGRAGLARAVLGSTADFVARFAPCPVTTVRWTQRPAVLAAART